MSRKIHNSSANPFNLIRRKPDKTDIDYSE